MAYTNEVILHLKYFDDPSKYLYLGVFYYMIGNIRPELRATQRAIQLIACVKSDYIKEYGFQPVLKPFIDDVKILAEVIYFFLKKKDCVSR